MNEQIVMGGGLILVSLWGLYNVDYLRTRSRFGQRIIDGLGEQTGTRMLLGVMLIGIVFGALLATSVIQPIRWEPSSNPEAVGSD
ncbi:hypothetical protein Pla110_26290 [Polystyrenella longa]|uniref:Uncharacterized protein n=1 Tax=Polystyrenella longa TaxID=2528007 RepID=A0A518CNV1_9PLAN|nr:hypothetical protein [Polystyrenella longa]QDU80893.1 hypothetical protein Pla110_26290 [Polystyrenella longa]